MKNILYSIVIILLFLVLFISPIIFSNSYASRPINCTDIGCESTRVPCALIQNENGQNFFCYTRWMGT